MIQKNFSLKDIDGLLEAAATIRKEDILKTASDKVLLAWAQIWDQEEFASFRERIRSLFPDFTTIGTNHFSREDIQSGKIDGSGEEKGILLSFLFFESSEASLFGLETRITGEAETGVRLNGLIKDIPDIKGIYLVVPGYFVSAEEVFREGLRGLEKTPVFGIKTSLLFEYQTFGYSKGGQLLEKLLFALVFHGKNLSLRLHYNLGWTPVGRIMTVTDEDNPFFVNKIDDNPATFVYNKYLGLRNDQIIPENLSEFPLIIYRNGIKISRIGISGEKEGQLVFGAPVYQNDRISLSYGNPDDLFSEIEEDSNNTGAFKPEAGLLIVCANRVMLLKDREQDEIEYYKRYIEDVPAIYGYAEIFYNNGKGGELNSALVSAFFKEETCDSGSEGHTGLTGNSVPFEAFDDPPAREDVLSASMEESNAGKENPAPGRGTAVPFTDRLARFFKEMSKDLLMAVEDAEEANRTKSAYFSCISHEFRTPLNSILGMNEMILKESEDDNITEYAENIGNSGKLLLQLVNDILDTEKIAAGKMEIIPVNYDIRKVIREIEKMVSLSAEEKGLKLSVEISDTLPKILFGDEIRIRQCILNILGNAIKYTETGEVVFRAYGERTDSEHIRLRISVKDTGIGIKPEDMEKLSIPFERVDTSRNHRIEGTGLGLNIVKNLLALMNSSLEIKSVYGEGSEFSFSLLQEIREEEDLQGAGLSQDNAPELTAEEYLKADGASVLIVDDTEMNIVVMRHFLKDTGISVDSALSGAEALQMARERKYDMIFLDHKMPEMDGSETFERMRSDPDGKNGSSVYIMLTASEEKSVRERFINEGFNDFISKPVKMKTLHEFIRHYLNLNGTA
ncbi:MAG: response regulator [Lachnospiraceae bacterium]|nr:response regulator [Lachnospiraceae bacterium]